MKQCHYKAVVVGGGIIGCSIASHVAAKLKARGIERSTLLVEAETLTSGTTWHAAGMVTQLKGNPVLSEMCRNSRDKYAGWGSDIGWHQTGSLGIARSEARWTQLLSFLPQLDHLGVPFKTYTGSELERLSDLHPLLSTDGLYGAVHLPTDGIVNPADLTMKISQEARQRGTEIVQNCSVEDFDVGIASNNQKKVTRIMTSKGDITCDQLVLACGQWTRGLLRQCVPGVIDVPVAPASHQYVIFDKIPGVTNAVPVIRDYDNRIYIKPEVGGLAVGEFEKNPKQQCISRELYGEDLEKSEAGLMGAMECIPKLQTTGIRSSIHGADAHSIDHSPVLGKVPLTENVYVACGFNSQGIQLGYSVGDMVSEMVVTGCPHRRYRYDTTCMDIARFDPQMCKSDEWCQKRVLESYGEMYTIHYPGTDWEVGRDVRLSSLHNEMKKLGAVFGSVPNQGWERPLWFSDGTYSRETHDMLSWDKHKTEWYKLTEKEHHQCREHVILFDMSSFGKFEVTGKGALDSLEWLTSASIGGTANGRVVYTQLLNEDGGIESDFTVVPMAPDRFYCTTGAGIVQRDMAYIAGKGTDVEIRDLSDEYAVLALMGPNSKRILEQLTPEALDDESFPFGTWKDLGFARAVRISFVGELGWELHVPRAGAKAVYAKLHEASMHVFNEPLTLGGYNAILRSLRVEKRFMHFGHDVSSTDTPLEAGFGFVNAKIKNGTPFIARDALLRQKDMKIRKKMVGFAVDDSSVSLWGHENIYRNGKLVGYLTSGGIGFTVNAGNAIGMGYVNSNDVPCTKDFIMSGEYEIDVLGRRVPAKVHFSAFYDPKNERMKSASTPPLKFSKPMRAPGVVIHDSLTNATVTVRS